MKRCMGHELRQSNGKGRAGPTARPFKTNRGLTLIELMVAIAIGLVITAAIVQIFVSSRSSYTMEEGLARVQEAGRFAVDLMSYDVRMAGYTGCLPRTAKPDSALNNPDDFATAGPNRHLEGYTYVGTGGVDPASDWSASLPATYFSSSELMPDSDVLVVRRGSEVSTRLKDPITTPSAEAKIAGNTSGLRQFDIVMITSCKQAKAEIFQVTGPASLDGKGDNNLVHNSGVGVAAPGNATKEFKTLFDKGDEIIKLLTHVYYVGPGPTGNPSLFRKELQGADGGGKIFKSQELVEGVVRLKVLFGIDTDGDEVANQFVPAKDVAPADTAKIFAVRLAMLVRTPDRVDSQPEVAKLDLLGTTYSPTGDDRFYRHRVFNSTIQLRN